MGKIKVLIIEDNEKLIEEMKKHFKNTNIEIVYSANNGEYGLDLINKKTDYDVVILDLVMPDKDGLYVLENIKKKIFNKIIVSTSNNSPYIINKVSSYGIPYYLLKPYDLTILEKRIYEISEAKSKLNNITKLLHEFGLPSHLKGSQYLEGIINEVYNSNTAIKDAYESVAKNLNTTPQKIERTIRYAIEIGFNRANISFVEESFGSSIDAFKGKPTNTEFLWTVVNMLKLKN